MIFLEFEEPLKDLYNQLKKLQEIENEGKVDVSSSISELKKQINDERKKIVKKLTPWQKVQLSRHPERPYTLGYIEYITKGNFIELHGDRNTKDDKAIIGGLGDFDGKTVMFIGHQKGVNTKMRQYRNFGMANPEGYRKAFRLMKLADKFNKPIIFLVDTPGAFPGIEGEERGQAEAIAKNLFEMFRLKVPMIVCIIGEGASGGALGIGIGDRILMMEYTWYSVISPESCSSILWRSWDYKKQAAEALKLTAKDLLELGIIDEVIKEPLGGAHLNHEKTFSTVKKELKKHLNELMVMNQEERIDLRIEKFSAFGKFKIDEPKIKNKV